MQGDLSSLWSRRIDKRNRLVYRIAEGNVEIISCKTRRRPRMNRTRNGRRTLPGGVWPHLKASEPAERNDGL
ncbi:MAG: type II toxin-antitoxin system YoeB family toxin [Eggerthella lenta]